MSNNNQPKALALSLEECMKVTIMRGLPGSGKSTLAKALGAQAVHSTDDYFMVNGQYVFNPALLGEYHGKNLQRTVEALKNKVPHIVVDNTCTQAWEAREYVKAAVLHGYSVEFMEPTTSWAKDPAECAKRCQHGVPEDKIRAMLNRWEGSLTIERCLSAKAPWEKAHSYKFGSPKAQS